MDASAGGNRQQFRGYLTSKKRLIFEGAIYHITQRAPGNELIFVEDSDYLRFLKIFKEGALSYSLQVFAFALVTNHLHMLLQIKEKNLSAAMKEIFERYAKYFNRKYERKGHVFCSRFRPNLCTDDRYLIAASIYIHLNPVRAGLCKGIEDYRWSSLRLYTHPAPESFVDPNKILFLLADDLDEAREKYIELLNHSSEVKSSISREIKPIKKIQHHIRSILARLATGENGDLAKLIERFGNGIRINKIEGQKARRYLVEQLIANGLSRAEIMQKLGISRVTLYRILSHSPNETKPDRLKMFHSGKECPNSIKSNEQFANK